MTAADIKTEFLKDNCWFFQNGGLKVLWWKQPFAGLMLHGKIETRTWPTDYRGWVLIVASKGRYFPSELKEFITENQYHMLCETVTFNGPEFCSNQVIAIARLVNCRMMKPSDEERTWVKYREPWQQRSKKTGKLRSLALWCHEYECVMPVEPFEFPGAPGWGKIGSENLPKIKFK